MSRRARRGCPTPILLVTIVGAGLLALEACTAQVTGAGTGARQGDCPADPPYAGEPCGASALCAYPGAGCGHSFSCDRSTWQSAGDVPRVQASACPSAIPTPGAPCAFAGQSCPFDVPGECPGVFVATCGAAHSWAVADQSPPCTPHPCPATEPTAGSACDYPYSCTYTVVPPGCAPQTEYAACVNGAWTIDAPQCTSE